MPSRRRQSAARSGSHVTLLAALLVGTLALASMLAYEAHDAARSHRATAEHALHDYAAVAAWELVAGVNEALESSLGAGLAPLTGPRASSSYEILASPALLAASADNVLRCATAAGDSARFYFRIDLRDGSLATDGAEPTPAMRAWLVDTVTAAARSVYQPDWPFAVLFGAPSGSTDSRVAIAYAVKYAEHSAPIAAYGIRTCENAIGPALIGDVIASRALLPTSVASGASNDSLMSVSVRDKSGRAIYESKRSESSPYSADVPLKQVGSLVARATIRPAAVQLLSLGAFPESRVPILVGLLTLTAAMVVLAVAQLRREHELSRLRSDFISSVSHELRTPLSQILLFAETLNLGRVRTEAERQSATDVIVQEGRRLMHLVENILHFSRAERQMTRLGLEPLDLSLAVDTIVEDWRPLASAVDVTVRTDFAGDVHALADSRALRQMVLNLLDNAVKYGPVGQTVTVGTSTSGSRARVWVDDQGPGVPPSERDRVWNPFYRLDRDANSSVAGSGIGLYIVLELARLHGGEAWVEDAPGGGARFVIELSAAQRAPGFTEEHLVATREARL
ncbi:MAG TPA: HAMP domain-containing sensor histidine kinase [Gemmatimonadaceae bacterium]|jgi:signal transduction histidine kinase